MSIFGHEKRLTIYWSERPTAQALRVIPGVFSCGLQLSGSVRRPTLHRERRPWNAPRCS
jgi:hypothetical protein